jgi:hypothetical protein
MCTEQLPTGGYPIAVKYISHSTVLPAVNILSIHHLQHHFLTLEAAQTLVFIALPALQKLISTI